MSKVVNSTSHSSQAKAEPELHDLLRSLILGCQEEEPDPLGEALARGEIPEEIAEELRIVPLDSPAGVQFQSAMHELVARICPAEVNLDEIGPRFFLMDDPEPNACHIKGSHPPLIGFTTGMFEPSQRLYPRTQDAREGIIFHEGYHVLFPGLGLKLEEGAADIAATRGLYYQDKDPKAYLEWLRLVAREASSTEIAIPKALERFFDPHPDPLTRVSYIEGELTRLEKSSQEVKASPRPIPPDDPFREIIKNAVHTSFVSRVLEREGYAQAGIKERVEILARLVRTNDTWNSSRTKDLARAIKELPAAQIPDELSRLADTLLEKIGEIRLPISALSIDAESGVPKGLAQSYELVDRRSYLAYLYKATCQATTSSDTLVPLGRLKVLAAKVEEFISASGHSGIKEKAIELKAAIQAEPLAQDWYLRDFLRRIQWPSFSLPQRLGEPAAWSEHLATARKAAQNGDDRIALGLLEVGVFQPELARLLSDQTVANLLGSQHMGHRMVPHKEGLGISAGTTFDRLLTGQGRKKESVSIGGSDIKVDIHGRLVSLPKSRIDRSKLAYRNYLESARALARFSLADQCLAADPKLEPARYNALQLWQRYGTKLAGISFFLEHPSQFRSLNATVMCKQPAAEKELSSVFDQLLCAPATTVQASTAIREFFEPQNFSFYSLIELAGNSLKPRLDRPLMHFLLGAPEQVFSWQEKLGRLMGEVERLRDKSHYREAGPLLECVLPAELRGRPATWSELLAQVQAFKELLAREKLELAVDDWSSALQLFAELKTPGPDELGEATTAEACRFLDVCGHGPLRLHGQGLAWALARALRQVSLDQNVETAAKQWCTLTEHGMGLVRPSTLNAKLEPLLKLIKQSADPAVRLATSEQILKVALLPNSRLRTRVGRIWAEAAGSLHGRDVFRVKLQPLVENARKFKSALNREAALRLLAVELEAQGGLLGDIKRASSFDNQASMLQADVTAFGLDAIFSAIQGKPRARAPILDFLQGTYSRSAAITLNSKLKRLGLDLSAIPQGRMTKREQSIAIVHCLHQLFWDSPIEVQVGLSRQLFFPVSTSSRGLTLRAVHQALKRLPSSDTPERELVHKFIGIYIRKLRKHQGPHVFTALLIGSEPGSKGHGLGRAISRAASSMGPAEYKLCQHAHSDCRTPENLRRDTARFKYNAQDNTPYQIHAMVNALPKHVRRRIIHIGRSRGSGAFFQSSEVIMEDKSTQILQLLTPHARERAAEGLRPIRETAQELARENGDWQALIDMSNESEATWLEEIDPAISLEKFKAARKLYHGLTVQVGDQLYTVQTPSLYKFGPNKPAWEAAYRIMSPLEGVHFAELALRSDKKSSAYCKTVAKGMGCLIIQNIMRGFLFDDDPHGGNLLLSGHTWGRLDWGGMLITPPTERDLEEIGASICDTLKRMGSGNDFAPAFLSVLKERMQSQGQVPRILAKVQKTLSAFGEYQLLIPPPDLTSVLISAMDGLHPVIQSVFENRLISGPLAFLARPQEMLALLPNPIKITWPAPEEEKDESSSWQDEGLDELGLGDIFGVRSRN